MAVGTPGYMAPEQVTGQPGRAAVRRVRDSGAVLFRMLTGRGPFAGGFGLGGARCDDARDPPPLAVAQAGHTGGTGAGRGALRWPRVRRRALPSGRELQQALVAVLAAIDQGEARPGAPRRRGLGRRGRGPHGVAAGGVDVAVAAANRARRWVRDEAIPGIGRLATSGDPVAAYRLAQRALAVAPDDPGADGGVGRRHQ